MRTPKIATSASANTLIDALKETNHLASQSLAAPSHPKLSISFPEPGAIRSRKVVTRSRARATGKFPSLKTGRMMQWESIPERNAFRLLEADPLVTIYHEQPCIIHYVMDDEEYRHYPDILVNGWSAPTLVEVKPRTEAMKPELIQRTTFMARELPNLGYQYLVWIAEDLASQPRNQNIAFLLRWGRNKVSLLVQEQMRQLLTRVGRISWRMVIDGALAPITKREICRLILNGFLTFDFDQPLYPSTEIRLGELS